jgi:hypothetical protein
MRTSVLALLLCLALAMPAFADDGRPKGCPTLWCGCWLALELFNRHTPELWLAANWLKFPRTNPEPGAVAIITRKKQIAHVGVVVGFSKEGNPIIRSGNHNGRVGVGMYPASSVLAYVKVK